MTATLSPSLQIAEPVIDGNSIRISWNENLNGVSLYEVADKLRAIDGVSYVEEGYYNNSVTLFVIDKFADVQEIARVASIVVGNELSGKKPPKVRCSLNRDGRYGNLATDYQHSDRRLLRVLQELGFNDLSFDRNGYNITYYGEPRGVGDIQLLLTEAINAFYAGRIRTRPFEYDRVRQDETSFTWLCNRRLNDDEQQRFNEETLASVEGLVELYFNDNGHAVTGTVANEFFDARRLGYEVIDRLVRKFAKA